MDDSLNNEKDILLLVEHFIIVANSLKGRKMPVDERIRFAEPLAKKAIWHIISALSLFNGTKLILTDNSYTKSVDFSSMAVLARAAIEAYLTFNYVLIQPENKEDQDFRFFCWDLAGFIERENYPEKNEKTKQLKQSEQKQKQRIIKQLEQNNVFQRLSNYQQKQIKNGNWRMGKSWTELAKFASLHEATFKTLYSYLCSYSHSGRLSIIQIEQNKNFQNEKEFSKIFQTINLLILSRLLMDYVNLIPECRKVFESNERAVYVSRIWNEIGNNLKL
jgi:hypothetical protein